MEQLISYAKAWSIYNGSKGTEKQVLKIVNQFKGNPESLIRMCQQRNITI